MVTIRRATGADIGRIARTTSRAFAVLWEVMEAHSPTVPYRYLDMPATRPDRDVPTDDGAGPHMWGMVRRAR